MRIRANRRYSEFAERVRTELKPVRYRGVTFRSAALEFARDFLSGEGSRLFGGRWNPPGFAVIYSSTRPGTAVEEAFQLARDFELVPDALKPRVTCGIEWTLSSVVDLTVKRLPFWIELEIWMREDFRKVNDSGFETLCQAFGRAVRNAGISGFLCPSARVASAANLVVFRDRLRKGDKMRVLGEKELRRHLA